MSFPFCLRQQVGEADCILAPTSPHALHIRTCGRHNPALRAKAIWQSRSVWVGLGELVSLSFIMSLKNDHFFTSKRRSHPISRNSTQPKLKCRNMNVNFYVWQTYSKNDKLIQKFICKGQSNFENDQVGRLTLPDFETCCKATEFHTVW